MLNGSELKILNNFFPEGENITLKELLVRTKLSYEPVYRNLKEFVKKGIIFKKKFGRTLVYSLNLEAEESKLSFFFYAKNRLKQFSEKHWVIFNALSKVNQEKMDFLAIFGSYAKGNYSKDSDIDVLCISSKKNESEQELNALKSKTNMDFSPVVLSKKEFKKIKIENLPFWNDLVKFGVIFKGYELFYLETYKK